MANNFKIGMQYCLPKQLLTTMAGKFAEAKLGFVTKTAINLFIKQYQIDMNEAQNPDSASFETFNDFFTRALKDGIRPINSAGNVIVYPADACVSQFGEIKQGNLIQAKGQTYEAVELLGGDSDLANEFTDGTFATLYLSPRDYHRVHMPCDATLRQMIYVPGELFSVNQMTAENVPNLFARNERLVCIFDTEFGPMAQILVGATIVGSIETTWAGVITPPRGKSIHRWDYPVEGEGAIKFHKGAEMGRFKLGSTVINLFAKDAVRFDETVSVGAVTRVGQAYGHLKIEIISKPESEKAEEAAPVIADEKPIIAEEKSEDQKATVEADKTPNADAKPKSDGSKKAAASKAQTEEKPVSIKKDDEK